MAATPIEWTDMTWNPVRGCTKVSPGCANCYAETFAERFRSVKGHPYEQGFDLRLVPEKLAEPLSWKKPRRVFVNSMSDLFQDGVPDQYIDRVFAVMAFTERHTFQILTKRAERMRDYMNDPLRFESVLEAFSRTVPRRANKTTIHKWPLPHVWLGVSIENQHFTDERIPLLLQTPAAIRFVSYEPALGPIDVRRWLRANISEREHGSRGKVVISQIDGIDWIIYGGESGAGARPNELAWARGLKEQVDCTMGGTKLFVKQFGSNLTANYYDDDTTRWWERDGREWPDPIDWHERDGQPKLDARVRLRLKKKGGEFSQFPPDLQVREFPEVRS